MRAGERVGELQRLLGFSREEAEESVREEAVLDAVADERARIRRMALDLAEQWEASEGDDVPNTKADLGWKAEGLRDFADLLGPKP